MKDLKNIDIMNILKDIAHEWQTRRTDAEKDAVVDYLNMVCYKWMGGNWGLRRTDIESDGERTEAKAVSLSADCELCVELAEALNALLADYEQVVFEE